MKHKTRNQWVQPYDYNTTLKLVIKNKRNANHSQNSTATRKPIQIAVYFI
jgi:hypothetical protein